MTRVNTLRARKVNSAYKGKKVLITGGLGFIGSNLAIRLVELGARVTIVDSSVRGCGANLHNISPVSGKVCVVERDVGEAAELRGEIIESEVIFNLAGEVSHIHSMEFPTRDAELNASAQLRFLQACMQLAPGIRIVYAGTRQIYGVPQVLPVDETHPVRPADFNGIHKYAATMYHLLGSRIGKLDAVVLCLTNVYGPRMALDEPCQGFLGNFLRRSLQGRPIEIYGEGRQLRDPLYVADAVDAFLGAGSAPELPSRLYNLGGPKPLQLYEIAEIASRVAGGPPPIHSPFPAERKAIDIGSYYADVSRIRQELSWEATVGFEEGVRRALAYYNRELWHYLDPSAVEPQCKLGLPSVTVPSSA